MNVIPVLLLPLVTETEFTEAEKVGMEPILWMQVNSCSLLSFQLCFCVMLT